MIYRSPILGRLPVICLEGVVALSGCDLPVAPSTPQPAPTAIPSKTGPLGTPNQPTAVPDKKGKWRVVSLQLAGGVARPQGGRGMAFSVDYDFSERVNDENIRYFLVILPTKGDPIRREVVLQRIGTVQ